MYMFVCVCVKEKQRKRERQGERNFSRERGCVCAFGEVREYGYVGSSLSISVSLIICFFISISGRGCGAWVGAAVYTCKVQLCIHVSIPLNAHIPLRVNIPAARPYTNKIYTWIGYDSRTESCNTYECVAPARSNNRIAVTAELLFAIEYINRPLDYGVIQVSSLYVLYVYVYVYLCKCVWYDLQDLYGTSLFLINPLYRVLDGLMNRRRNEACVELLVRHADYRWFMSQMHESQLTRSAWWLRHVTYG